MRARKILPLGGLGAALAATALALSACGGHESANYTVYATFKDAAGILKNYQVKVGEVRAGTVKKVTLDPNDHAVVKLEMDKGAAPIGTGASARVRPVNLLGEKYIDLDPGDLRRPQPSSVRIPLSRTSVPVELDDVLNMLDPTTRGALRILVNEAGLGMAGRGANFNRVLTDLPPALDSARRLVAQVARENQALDRLVGSGDRVLASIGPKGDKLGELVASAANALRTVATRREQLGQTVRNAPSALAQLRHTLAKLQGAAMQLAPAARDLRASAPALTSTLQQAPQFAADARGALAEARRVAPKLQRLGRQSTPTLRELQPASARLATFAGDFQPFLDSLDHDKSLNHFQDFMDGWADVTGQADGLGHVFRLRATFDEEFVTSVLQKFYGGVPVRHGKKRVDLRPTVVTPPRVRLPKLSTKKITGPLTDALGKTLDKAGKALNGLVGGASAPNRPTGAHESDAGRLLDYLLGS